MWVFGKRKAPAAAAAAPPPVLAAAPPIEMEPDVASDGSDSGGGRSPRSPRAPGHPAAAAAGLRRHADALAASVRGAAVGARPPAASQGLPTRPPPPPAVARELAFLDDVAAEAAAARREAAELEALLAEAEALRASREDARRSQRELEDFHAWASEQSRKTAPPSAAGPPDAAADALLGPAPRAPADARDALPPRAAGDPRTRPAGDPRTRPADDPRAGGDAAAALSACRERCAQLGASDAVAELACALYGTGDATRAANFVRAYVRLQAHGLSEWAVRQSLLMHEGRRGLTESYLAAFGRGLEAMRRAGHAEDRILDALSLFDGDAGRAADFLRHHAALLDMNFPDLAVREALLLSDNRLDEAMDLLLNPSASS
jgi:hypothetical protein